jgi:hypothetical protein
MGINAAVRQRLSEKNKNIEVHNVYTILRKFTEF